MRGPLVESTSSGRKLRLWLARRGLTQGDFALLVGVSESMVYKWLSGESLPRRAHMLLIYKTTRGAVTPNDFFELPRLRPRQRPAALVEGAAE